MYTTRILSLFLTILVLAGDLPLTCAEETPPAMVLTADNANDLAVRWAQAMADGKRQGTSYWVGYSFSRWMEKDGMFVVMADLSIFSDGLDERKGKSLYERIHGERPTREPLSEEEALQKAAERALAHSQRKKHPVEKAWREVGLLFHYNASASGPADFFDMWLGNVEFPFDPKGQPLIWVGEAEDSESFAWLTGLYDQVRRATSQEFLVEVVGAHSIPETVVPFLQNVLTSDADDGVREEAVDWLGRQEDERVVGILLKAAQGDRSGEIREEAVESIGEQGTEEAIEALIDLARHSTDSRVREEAVESLGETYTPRAAEALEQLAFEDPIRSVQEEAIEALAELPRETALPILIRLVKTHPSAAMREEAIEHLVEVATVTSSLDTLEWTIMNDPNHNVQEEAIEALAELPDGAGIPLLIKMAESHQHAMVREEAIDQLEDSKDARARAAYKKLSPKDGR